MRSKLLLVAVLSGSLAVPALAQRQQPPAPGPMKDFRLPPRRTVDLPNGGRLSMVPYGTVPKITVSVVVQTGTIDESADEVQLASLTADLLTEGTLARSGPDISREAAEMGGSLTAVAGTDAVVIGGEALSEFADRFIALAADVTQHPRFASADVARVRANRLRSNAIALSQPQEQARQLFRQAVLGDHPYARLYPDEKLLQSYDSAKVRNFYQRNFGGRRLQVYLSGVFDPAAVERAVRAEFRGMAAGTAKTVNPPEPVARRRLEVMDRPGAVQSTIWLGLPVADPTDPDWVRFNVTDALLGGAFGSRITRNIREDKGYTYSPFSFIWARPGMALWIEQADVTTSVTGASLQEIFGEIDSLRKAAPPVNELDGIKKNLTGIFVIRNSSRQGVLSQLQFVDQHGLGEAYLDGYVRNVLGVTPDQVRTMAVKYLDPARMTIAVVGDRKIIDEQLRPYQPAIP